MYHVYVLVSSKDNQYYIGQTRNIAKRLERHNNGFVKSTRNRRPLSLVHSEIYPTRSEALKREKFLKSGEGHRFINTIVEKYK
jgi:putative endonuclease